MTPQLKELYNMAQQNAPEDECPQCSIDDYDAWTQYQQPEFTRRGDPFKGSVHSVAEAAQKKHFPLSGDPYHGGYRHCVAGCILKRRYSFMGDLAVCLWDSLFEDYETPDSLGDMAAERHGLQLANSSNKSCAEACLTIYRSPEIMIPAWKGGPKGTPGVIPPVK